MPCRSVLLLEDNPINLTIATAMLRSIGLEVETAETIAEAQHKLAHAQFDALLFDIQLPDGNGIALAQEYSATGGKSPVVLLSSPELAAQSEYDSTGFYFLEKPFTVRQLQDAISAVV